MRVILYLVRHADAGDRKRWAGPDQLRALSPRGQRQAADLATLLEGSGVARVASSPAVRCVQTVQPLADAHGISVEPDQELQEGGDPEGALRRLEELARAGVAVACSHGDVIPAVLGLLSDGGLRIEGPTGWRKGSTWVLEGEAGNFHQARYLEPPG